MKITPVATMRSFTQAETAKEINDNINIQMAQQETRGMVIHRCDQNHPSAASPDCRPNKSKPGIQVTADKSSARTASFPNTYSGRLNGRLRNKGRAPFVKSPEIRTGPTQQFRRKATWV